MATLVLSWPHRDLSQNGRMHWSKRARATASYRNEAAWLAKAAGVATDPNAIITFTYYPPDLRRRDVHNVHGMMKAAIDGIADAMGCDDRRFRCRFPDSFGDVRKNGQIIIEISRLSHENAR